MSQDYLNTILDEFDLPHVFFGSEGFRIYRVSELPEAQIGYSKHPDGTDLTGNNDGDWKKEWVVIGKDTSLGDPFLVDTSKEHLPVYTVMHGVGAWEPKEISGSLHKFLSSLRYLYSVSPVDYSRIDPDHATITDENELEELEKKLCELNGENSFWASFIECHREWLEESNS